MDVPSWLFGNCENLPRMPDKLILKLFFNQDFFCHMFKIVFGWVKLARLEIFLYSVAVLRNDQVPFSSLLIQHLKNQDVNRFSVR